MGFVDPNSIDNPTAGNVAPAAWGDAVRDAIVYVAQTGPRVKTLRSATQSIPNTTDTAIAWTGTEQYDTDTMHDLATNPSRITATTAGLYLFTAYVEFAAGTGQRKFGFMKNGTVVEYEPVDCTNLGGFTCGHYMSGTFVLAAADYFEVYVYQNTGGALNVNATSYCAAQWIGV